MARVIKAGGAPAQAQRRPVARIGQPGRPVIEREVWRAQQEAAAIGAEAEAEAARIVADGKKQAAQAREEAQAEGAQEAFAQAAQEALLAFRHRAERYAEAADDIQVLALEVVKKVLGADPQLSKDALRAVLDRGMARLRARRRLRVQVPASRLSALAEERPALLAALQREPDLVVEAASDVSPGFARVVTEVGGALCAEQTALDQLAEAVSVDEQAVAPRPRSALHALADLEAQRESPREPEREPEREPVRPLPPAIVDDEDDDESTQLVTPPADLLAPGVLPAPAAPSASPVPAARPASTNIGLAATAPEVHLGDIHPGPRVRRLDSADPEATMQLDVRDLQRELSEAQAPDDDLDLFADDALPEP